MKGLNLLLKSRQIVADHFKRELAPSLNSFQAQSKAKNEGVKSITPHWRTLKMEGVLNEKFPGGADARKNCWDRRDT